MSVTVTKASDTIEYDAAGNPTVPFYLNVPMNFSSQQDEKALERLIIFLNEFETKHGVTFLDGVTYSCVMKKQSKLGPQAASEILGFDIRAEVAADFEKEFAEVFAPMGTLKRHVENDLYKDRLGDFRTVFNLEANSDALDKAMDFMIAFSTAHGDSDIVQLGTGVKFPNAVLVKVGYSQEFENRFNAEFSQG